MQRSIAGPAFLLLLAVVIAACGGGGSSPDGGATASADAPTATDTSAATDAAAPTDSPVATPAPATDGGGASAADVCGLITVEEIGDIFGVSGVTQGFFPGPPDTCDYQLDGAPFAAIVLTEQAASFVFDAMAADAASESIDGIGDRAVYNSQLLVLLVEVDDAIVSMSTFDPTKTDDERAELMRQIAVIVAGRM